MKHYLNLFGSRGIAITAIHGDNKFTVLFKMDVTSKLMGNQRVDMEEVGLYTLKNGKISQEEFFYATPEC